MSYHHFLIRRSHHMSYHHHLNRMYMRIDGDLSLSAATATSVSSFSASSWELYKYARGGSEAKLRATESSNWSRKYHLLGWRNGLVGWKMFSQIERETLGWRISFYNKTKVCVWIHNTWKHNSLGSKQFCANETVVGAQQWSKHRNLCPAHILPHCPMQSVKCICPGWS